MSMECVKLVVEAIDTVHWECRKKVRFVPLCGAALDQPVKGSKGPFMSIDTKGGLQTFAASAKLKGQREESGRSRYQPVFSIVLMQLRSAVSPKCRMLRLA
jgi:hypothetical protein